MKCSFSLTQIGEFAFILATLGTSLKVTSDFLYPIVVAVSVFTTFTTPYMIRLAEPAYNALARILPAKLLEKLERNSDDKNDKEETDEMRALWRKERNYYFFVLVVNSVLCTAIIALMYYYGAPVIYDMLPDPWSGIVTAIVTLFICAPFLWAMMRRGGDSDNVNKLWYEGSRMDRVKITALGLFRIVLGAFFVAYIIGNTLPRSGIFGIFAIVVVVFLIFVSPHAQKRSEKIAKTFHENLNQKEAENA
jgi:CPA2 family monovalent cation:H+ antiporter-2